MAGGKLKKILIMIVIFIAICCLVFNLYRDMKIRDNEEKNSKEVFGTLVLKSAEKTFFLLPAYMEEGGQTGSFAVLRQHWMAQQSPLMGYVLGMKDMQTEGQEIFELIIRQEGSDEERREIDEKGLDYEKDAMHIEGSMLKDMEQENSRYREGQGGDLNPENSEKPEFLPAKYPAYTYDWSETWEYDELVSNFYAIDNSTELKEEYLDLNRLLYRDLSINKDTEGPQILIYHTHSQEGFVDSIEGDPSTTIVGAGEELARILENDYGFQVLHYTGEFDAEDRDYAYSNSLPVIEQILWEYPTIEVIIDLHRDAVKEGNKLVMDLQGRPTARFMFFNGMSYIRGRGDISYLENPYIQDNLSFSFQAQVAANEYYPGIARKIYLKAYRYNMHLMPKSMLIELGAQTNTVEEIMNACEPLAHIISIVLDENL